MARLGIFCILCSEMIQRDGNYDLQRMTGEAKLVSILESSVILELDGQMRSVMLKN